MARTGCGSGAACDDAGVLEPARGGLVLLSGTPKKGCLLLQRRRDVCISFDMGTNWHKTTSFLKAVADEMAARGTVSQELSALVFDHDADRVRVHLRVGEHTAGYPDLDTILSVVAYDCRADEIEVEHLRQIEFLPEAVNLECVVGDDQAVVYVWPIQRLH